MRIIGISGRSQAGKNMCGNAILGEVLSTKITFNNQPLISDYKIDERGLLYVPAQISETEVVYGIFDPFNFERHFVDWANQFVFPHCKLYSFATLLKEKVCSDVLGIPLNLVFGDDKAKAQDSHIPRTAIDAFSKTKKKAGVSTDAPPSEYLSVREVLQFVGTELLRKFYPNVWSEGLLRVILTEQSELAVVIDVRFPNEVAAIKDSGGRVIRLLRDPKQGTHDSETALDPENYDQSNFDLIVDNRELSINETKDVVIKYVRELEWI